MKLETIIALIEDLNKGNAKEYIFLNDLHSNVQFAMVWLKPPNIANGFEESKPKRFYFILNENREYVGAIYDMCFDLHWFINPEHRNKKHLKNSLMKVVLPYILQSKENGEIQISIDTLDDLSYISSRAIAESCGFKETEKDKFVLKIEDFDFSHENIDWNERKIEKERLESLKREVLYAARILQKAGDEIGLSIGEFGLRKVGDEASKFYHYIDGLIWNRRD